MLSGSKPKERKTAKAPTATWLKTALNTSLSKFVISRNDKADSVQTHQFVLFQLLGVNAVRVPDASVPLRYSNTLRPVAVQVTHGVQAHITKALKQKHKHTPDFCITH